MDRNEIEYKVKSAIFGFAVGDALGVPVEFKKRKHLKKDPVTDMRSGGTYGLPAGTWSDDTSMILAEMDVLCDGLDYSKIMEAFCEWKDNGKYSATGECFDIGNTTSDALKRFQKGTLPLECGGDDEFDNGNGSLMRILPFALHHTFSLSANNTELPYCCAEGGPYASCPEINSGFEEYIFAASSLTHRHIISQTCCYVYADIIYQLIDDPFLAGNDIGKLKELIEWTVKGDLRYCRDPRNNEPTCFDRLLSPDFEKLSEDEIKSTGYVVHTLEAVVWCILNTDSYEECVLKAVNLGGDTDTIAALAGGLAGFIYGYDNIPQTWLDTLKKRDIIEELCGRFSDSLIAQWNQIIAVNNVIELCTYYLQEIKYIVTDHEEGDKHIKSYDFLNVLEAIGLKADYIIEDKHLPFSEEALSEWADAVINGNKCYLKLGGYSFSYEKIVEICVDFEYDGSTEYCPIDYSIADMRMMYRNKKILTVLPDLYDTMEKQITISRFVKKICQNKKSYCRGAFFESSDKLNNIISHSGWSKGGSMDFKIGANADKLA